jgi:hypothetical protein
LSFSESPLLYRSRQLIDRAVARIQSHNRKSKDNIKNALLELIKDIVEMAKTLSFSTELPMLNDGDKKITLCAFLHAQD